MIQLIVEERRKILSDFLDEWPLDRIEKMKLSEYNLLGSKDSFCHWLERKANDVGSIKGMGSLKFSIYERKPEKKSKIGYSDERYTWLKSYGHPEDRNAAFKEVRDEIVQIIEYSAKGDFKAIDNLKYRSFSKWKIAFMYSNERLIPIFKWEVLKKIVQSFGENVYDDTPVSKVQEIIIKNKPAHQNVFEYAYDLWFAFSDKNEPGLKSGRRGTRHKNTEPQKRSGSAPYTATQKHNEIQNRLIEQLITEYGENNVHMEKNYIDIKVNHRDGKITYYEVKANSHASDCIRNALGQILAYAHDDNERKEKYDLVIVGQYPATNTDKAFIKFINKVLNVNFHYEFISLT